MRGGRWDSLLERLWGTSTDYATEDPETESGFKEETTDRCIVTMRKVSMLVSVAGQTAQNTANIDYLAMEAGIEL